MMISRRHAKLRVFRLSKMAAGGHFGKKWKPQIFVPKCVLGNFQQKKFFFLTIQDGRRRPFWKKIKTSDFCSKMCFRQFPAKNFFFFWPFFSDSGLRNFLGFYFIFILKKIKLGNLLSGDFQLKKIKTFLFSHRIFFGIVPPDESRGYMGSAIVTRPPRPRVRVRRHFLVCTLQVTNLNRLFSYLVWA